MGRQSLAEPSSRSPSLHYVKWLITFPAFLCTFFFVGSGPLVFSWSNNIDIKLVLKCSKQAMTSYMSQTVVSHLNLGFTIYIPGWTEKGYESRVSCPTSKTIFSHMIEPHNPQIKLKVREIFNNSSRRPVFLPNFLPARSLLMKTGQTTGSRSFFLGSLRRVLINREREIWTSRGQRAWNVCLFPIPFRLKRLAS